MNNEKSMGKRIKELLARKTLPTVLAGSMIFGSGALLEEVNAYSLDEPIQGYEDFINYNGIKVFINGRFVEFNESTGYPFVINGSTMIPLRAVSEAFGAKVTWNEYSKTASVSKYDLSVDVTVDSKEMKVKDLNDNSISIENVTKEAMVKDGRTYIPLRSLFECFGLSVRWDNQKQIAHIETVSLESLENIDFKEEKVYTINELTNMKDIKSIEYDGKEIDKEYLGVLSESNQYVVIVEDKDAKVFSYQFLRELNQIFDLSDKLLLNLEDKESKRLYFRNATKEDVEFLSDVYYYVTSTYEIDKISSSKEEYRKDYKLESICNKNNYMETVNVASEMADKIKNSTSDTKEQIIMAVNLLNNHASYDHSNTSSNSAYSALVLKNAKCTGFAYAFNLLMQKLNIPCIYFAGPVNNGKDGHAWNYVYLDGEWYICDATNNKALLPISSEYYDALGINYHEEVELVKLAYKFGK